MYSKAFIDKRKGIYYLLLALAIGLASVSVSLVALQAIDPRLVMVGIGSFAGLAFLLFLITKPGYGLPILVFITFTRAPEVVPGLKDLPSLSILLAAFLAGVILFRWIYFNEPVENWQKPAVFLGAFGLMVLASLLYAADQNSIRDGLNELITDILIVMVVVILLRSARELSMVVWALLAAGILLGTLTTIQQIIGNFSNSYLGFSQVEISHIVGSVEDYRVIGPGLEPNSYGMYMLWLIPLAMDRIWNERKLLLRVVALWAFAVVSLTIMFTFSRGASISLAFVIVLFFIQHPPKFRTVVYLAILGVALFPFVPPRYTDRLSTLLYFVQGSEETESDGLPDIRQVALSDPSFKGRLSENLVGIQMASDHPVMGVGYRNFAHYYQSYSRSLGLDSRRVGRGAHNLYLQIAAEMGIIGLVWFGTLIVVVIKGLRGAKERFRLIGMDQAVFIVMALSLALAGFLIGSVFRHLTYPRYVWLLFGILLAIPNLSKFELEKIRRRRVSRT